MSLLGELVQASQRVGATAARRVKINELAALLKLLTPDEIDIAVHYLSGEIPQGKIGIGYAAVRAAASAWAADVSKLSIAEVDDKLSEEDQRRGAQRLCRNCSHVRRRRNSSFCCVS